MNKLSSAATPPLRAALVLGLAGAAVGALAAEGPCSAQSGERLTPVIELYTSEGCSSCPPADRWLSTLKGQPAVVEAFHVGYWDYIGWVDRFAAPAYTTRQRQLAQANGQTTIYTPQVLRNGRDWADRGRDLAGNEPARAKLRIRKTGPDQFEADVAPASGATTPWSAYWTVTENGHGSKVKAGENAGALLQHDFVVRQYTPAGAYRGPATLKLRTIAADPAHPRRINLVVQDPASGVPLQAVSLTCG